MDRTCSAWVLWPTGGWQTEGLCSVEGCQVWSLSPQAGLHGHCTLSQICGSAQTASCVIRTAHHTRCCVSHRRKARNNPSTIDARCARYQLRRHSEFHATLSKRAQVPSQRLPLTPVVLHCKQRRAALCGHLCRHLCRLWQPARQGCAQHRRRCGCSALGNPTAQSMNQTPSMRRNLWS